MDKSEVVELFLTSNYAGPYYSFTPQPDIAPWELAQILKAMQMKLTGNLVTPEIARHCTVDAAGKS